MIKQQAWTPDTHTNRKFIIEYDSDDFDGTAKCVSHNQEEYEDALRLNKHKNQVIIPAMLEVLPAEDKKTVIDDDGNEHETFKQTPKFTAVDGKIVADLNHVKDADIKAALETAVRDTPEKVKAKA